MLLSPAALLLMAVLPACRETAKAPIQEAIRAMDLKRGELVVCSPADRQFGKVSFECSCTEAVKKELDLAIALLHSFEYDEAEKVFAKVIDKEPDCAMAYWGVAMCNYHPLWSPPLPAELKKGTEAVTIARSIVNISARESAYIEAIGAFYDDWPTTPHATRCLNFEEAMERLHAVYPADKEAAIFYALALDGAADPADTSYQKQKKAGAILSTLYPNEPDHPGLIHYIIHSYDYPELATLALPAARKYASIAPASAHAQHMPSHIFTRLGLWEDCIQSNQASVAAAKCYAENTGIKGHWDEELHGLDYLVYAYLQKGDNTQARVQRDYLQSIDVVYPSNFKVAYAFAAIPSRYALENRSWHEAASLSPHPDHFPWEKFPWQKAIIHFTRLLGAVHLSWMDAARTEYKKLSIIHDTLVAQKDVYKANQVMIQMKAGEAWILWKSGKNSEALALMQEAAGMEDKTQKHPVTPGEVVPARELLGDLLLEMGKPAEALAAYEANLKERPNRFNGLVGAARAAEKLKDTIMAKAYYEQLLKIVDPGVPQRKEQAMAQLYLDKQPS